jgi:anaerobic selenocysteine-containing dehydrogenase
MAYHHSRLRNHAWARKIQADPELGIHPETAARHAIGDGGWVWVETPADRGRIRLRAHVTEEVPVNVVATGMGWWYPEQPGFDHGALSVNVDAVVPYGPHWDPITGSAEARNIACRIRRVEPEEIAAAAVVREGRSAWRDPLARAAPRGEIPVLEVTEALPQDG